MANSYYAPNDPLAVKLWSKKLHREALKETWASKFMGTSSNSVVQLKNEAAKDKGDRVRIGLRMQLTGDGVLGDTTLEGEEEGLTTYTDDIFIDQLRHAVRSAGKMSEQRVSHDVRAEAKDGLKDWWADRIDTWFMNQVAGNTVVKDARYTGLQAVPAASSDRVIIAGGHANEQSLTATDVFSLSLIDQAVEVAKTASPLIRPIRANGENCYVMFLHPYQVTDLRTNTDSGQWLDIQKAAMAGGKVKDNPIFTGALGKYNNVVLHESTRLPQAINSSGKSFVDNSRRAVFCGAQAACMAMGQAGSPNRMEWHEESFDYGNQLGVEGGLIAGLKKTQFNNKDFATIVVPTFAAAHI